MLIEPLRLLLLLIALIATTRIVYAIRRKSYREALQALARNWQMHYSASDQFNLSSRVADRFPVIGAAEIRVVDLIYGSDGRSYRYLFCAEYTTGVLQGKHRHRRVATLTEPKEPAVHSLPLARPKLVLADASDNLVDQYEQLHRAMVAEPGND